MMNQADRQELEDRVHEANEDPYSPTDERIEEIKQRAFKEYSQVLETAKANAVDEKPAGRQKKRSILRRAAIAVALAVCFLAASMLYSALAPVTAANANNFVRRTSIWLNDQLHLGIVFSTPMEDENAAINKDGQTFVSIEDLKTAVNFPIVLFPETESLKISSVEINAMNQQTEVFIRYAALDGKNISLKFEPFFENTTIGIETSATTSIDSSIGTIYMWTDGKFSYAISILAGSTVNITSSASVEELAAYCQTLYFLN